MPLKTSIILSLSAAFAAILLLPPPLHAEDDAEATIRGVVERYHAALAAGDAEAAQALLSADVMVLEGGHLETAEEYRSHHLGADMEFAAAVSSERTVREAVVHGDTGWVISSSVSEGTFREHAIDSAGAELIVLVREDGAWKIRAIHWSSHNRKR